MSTPPPPRGDGAADGEDPAGAAAGRDGLAAQLRELEAFVARADASGDALPPEASEMVERLREIVAALDGLTASMRGPAAPGSRADDAASGGPEPAG